MKKPSKEEKQIRERLDKAKLSFSRLFSAVRSKELSDKQLEALAKKLDNEFASMRGIPSTVCHIIADFIEDTQNKSEGRKDYVDPFDSEYTV